MAELQSDDEFARLELESQNDLRFLSLKPWDQEPSHLTCPSSANGWAKGKASFPGTVWNGTSGCGLFEQLPLEIWEKIYGETVELQYTKRALSWIQYSESEECQMSKVLRSPRSI